ncbi:hypothetical protein [Actinomadura atramentaria]|uniref:hypothetical protein n=1 Tax=Actinomadura atramentaria TaxID=1990 RepID=UPI00035C4B09|nr:hypothetical protein [Actinomadura atramentaria]
MHHARQNTQQADHAPDARVAGGPVRTAPGSGDTGPIPRPDGGPTRPDQARPEQTRGEQARADQVGAGQNGADQSGIGQNGAGPASAGQPGPVRADGGPASPRETVPGGPSDETAARTRPDADARPGGNDPLVVGAEDFRRRWHDLQASFVDDPRTAVRRADDLTGEAVDALGRALAERRGRLVDGDAGTDTERLRQALRGYRALLDRILSS